jgi:acyl carrier protein
MLITVDEVCKMIRKKVRGKRAAELVLDENSVFADLGLSSLQIADLVYGIEDNLGMEFDPVQAADAKTIGDLVRLVNSTAQRQA